MNIYNNKIEKPDNLFYLMEQFNIFELLSEE